MKDPSGANAKIAVQELLTQDNVDVLAGWIYSPNAIASAPVVAAGKKLSVIMNAGTAHITNMAPQYVRTAFSMWHAGYSLGEAAAKQLNAKTAVVGYTDFPPGKDSLNAFKAAFEAGVSPAVMLPALVTVSVRRVKLAFASATPSREVFELAQRRLCA